MLLLTMILSVALALPNQDRPAPRPNCIRMTPEKEQQIDQIVEKLGHFLNNLTIEHEHFDISLIKLAIELHTEDEEEKETVLQLSVNDCQLTDDELEEIDHHRQKAKKAEEERKAKKELKSKNKEIKEDDLKDEQRTDENIDEKHDKVKNEQEQQDNTESEANDESKLENYDKEVIPHFMYLDLDENGQKLEQALGKKNPRIVYVQQRNSGQQEYWFLKRR